MDDWTNEAASAAAAIEERLAELRPKLHRYCSRMVGAAFDGEDVVQEALAKAVQALVGGARPEQLEAWLMRVAHNAAIDFLRRRRRDRELLGSAAGEAAAVAPAVEDRALAAAGLKAFLALPTAQRSCVILKDVLGYSLDEVGGMLHHSAPAVKAALHRGRARVRDAAAALEAHAPPALSAARLALYRRYVDRFNARDFDAIRDMLAEEVWLDMVARRQIRGAAEVSGVYLRNYGLRDDWRLALGVVDGRPALVVQDAAEPGARLAYFVELEWTAERVTRIRDFRYARYVVEGADAYLLD